MYLTRFPLIHSDESWLAGMTNTYLTRKSLFVTESFFDLMPRTVHTIKVLYHLLQMPFLLLFGFSVESVRLLSLVVGIISLYIFYTLINSLFRLPLLSLISTILLSLNLQFIYASHFARQEIVLFMLLILTYRIYTTFPENPYLLGFIIGLSISLHPNAFIIAAMIGILLVKDALTKKRSFKCLISYVVILACFALAHILITLSANPAFIEQYVAYGRTLNVDAVPLVRLENFKDFYLKLYYQITGTYYIPPLKSFFHFYSILLILSIFLFFKYKTNRYSKKNPVLMLNSDFMNPVLMVIAFNLSLYIIGRYNTTSIVLLIFPFYLLLSHLTFYILQRLSNDSTYLSKKLVKRLLICLGIVVGISSSIDLYREVSTISRHNYTHYLNQISPYITEDSVILGNLSSGFIFSKHTFYDIRNLDYLNELSLEDYIETRQINTILYYEEYDYIERNPKWTILYGSNFKPSLLKDYLNKKATLIHTFTDTYYGSRIIDYMGDYPWKIELYTLKP
jgi:hypothetical protein